MTTPERAAREEGNRSRSSIPSAFVGRKAELAALLTGLDDAIAGRGRLFLIGGEPGIGKSRLADELAAQAKACGIRALWGRCWEAGGAPAYWPWVQSLRSQLRDCDKDTLRAQLGPGGCHVAQIIPEIRELFLDASVPLSSDPDSARFGLFSAVVDFLRNVARVQPMLLVLDDLHAADAPSLLLLQFLAGELADSRLVVVGTYRDTDLDPDHPLDATLVELARHRVTHSLTLTGLAVSDVARFIELTIGRTPPGGLVAAVHGETEGNPLFVGELARLLARDGELDPLGDAASWRLHIPQGIKQVIRRRINPLSDECRHVLSVASVVGREFEPEVLEHVSALPAGRLPELLEEATGARVIIEAPHSLGRLRFAHALMRETLYDDLSPTRRMRLHRQVGEALEALYARNLDPHLAELAFHFIEAVPVGEVEKAVFYARSAGDRALRLLAYEEAVRLYETALQALDLKEVADELLRCDLLLALGDARARAGEFPKAKESFLRAADIARALGAPAHLARAALGYGGRFVWEAGRGDPHLVRLLDDALIGLGTEDSSLRARVMARLAGGPLRDDRAREPRAMFSHHAVEMAQRLGDPDTLAYALDGRYAAVWWPENLEERLAIATELVQAAHAARDRERALQGYHYRCLALLELGDMAGVSAELDAQAQLAEELRQPAHHWYVAVVRATLATFQGRFQEAEELIPHALALGQRAHGPMATVYHTLQLYALRREQARLEELEPTVRRVAHDFPTYPVLRCVLAHLCAELGQEGEARSVFDRLAADEFAGLPLDDEWVFSMSLLADVAERLGDVPRAATLYRLLLPYSARNAVSNPDMCIGSVSRSLGILAGMAGQWRDAARHFEDALAMNARTGGRPWVARAQHGWAHVLLARDAPGDRERALELLAGALGICRELGLTALSRPVALLLSGSRAGASAPRAGEARSVRPGGAPRSPSPPSVFRREGEYWSIAYEGEGFRLKDAKGLRYLARLLAEPGRELHVLDLVAADAAAQTTGAEAREGHLASMFGDAGPVLDPQAKSAYRRRLAELRADLEEAETRGDHERAARATEEIDLLEQELARALGLGGRDRRAVAVAERARVNVTRAVKAALTRIQDCSPGLGRHLEMTIRTGIFCSYVPDPRAPLSWRT